MPPPYLWSAQAKLALLMYGQPAPQTARTRLVRARLPWCRRRNGAALVTAYFYGLLLRHDELEEVADLFGGERVQQAVGHERFAGFFDRLDLGPSQGQLLFVGLNG